MTAEVERIIERGRQVVAHLTASDPPIWYKQKRGLAVDATQEEWRPVVGYEGYYEVSNLGRVKSVERRIPASRGSGYRTMRGRILRQGTHSGGYGMVYLCVHGKKLNQHVHLLVLTAFRGPRPAGMVCCHNDGDPTNNRLDNLRWGTQADNLRDQVRHGRHPWANKTRCPQDHEYTPENTVVHGGGRYCRQCEKDRVAKRRAARNASRCVK